MVVEWTLHAINNRPSRSIKDLALSRSQTLNGGTRVFTVTSGLQAEEKFVIEAVI